ncbi:MAG TPA: LLM class flavin-dependent oxidoreductase [Polyangiaceae bacterium]|jgi:luciferase family oxidoreductase group 1|nr:LLM class flavin-dependent oxidoreductase [Polyangiaceae bacterium]
MVPVSLLDLSPITEGADASASFRNSVDLARHAEEWGYTRYWLAEHHNMPGIASAATAVVIGHVAGATRKIRVGAGGVMLPNHAPLVIAEQFGTLEAMYPGRIDLGLGRAPGTDQRTAHALRRDAMQRADSFPSDVVELLSYLGPPTQNNAVRAVPGTGSSVPVWLLGSSLFSAGLAAELGLPFSFASHFAPDHLMGALELYRSHFKPSSALTKPHAMPAIAVFAADTDAEARRLFTSLEQAFVQLRRGAPGPLRPPVDDIEARLSPMEQAMLEHTFAYALVGSKETVRQGLEEFVAATRPDELMVTAQIYDHAARLRSFEIVSEIFRGA